MKSELFHGIFGVVNEASFCYWRLIFTSHCEPSYHQRKFCLDKTSNSRHKNAVEQQNISRRRCRCVSEYHTHIREDFELMFGIAYVRFLMSMAEWALHFKSSLSLLVAKNAV